MKYWIILCLIVALHILAAAEGTGIGEFVQDLTRTPVSRKLLAHLQDLQTILTRSKRQLGSNGRLNRASGQLGGTATGYVFGYNTALTDGSYGDALANFLNPFGAMGVGVGASITYPGNGQTGAASIYPVIGSGQQGVSMIAQPRLPDLGSSQTPLPAVGNVSGIAVPAVPPSLTNSDSVSVGNQSSVLYKDLP